MGRNLLYGVALALLGGAGHDHGGGAWAQSASTNPPAWLSKPLALTDCLNLALQHNGAILKSGKDLEANHGVVIQTRAVALPKLRVGGDYSITDEGGVERLDFPSLPGMGNFAGIDPGNQQWSANVRLVQSIYEGGRIRSALRAAKLTRAQAEAQHQAVVADTVAEVRAGYYDVLLAAQQIVVSEASLQLLQRELEDTTRRFNAGTVPRFNVLRAEVELANARPRLIRARNAHRIAKSNLTHLLGYALPKELDIPLELSGTLEVEQLQLELSGALAQALQRRPELVTLRKAEELRREGVTQAKGKYLPRVEGFVGYGWRKSSFYRELDRDVAGWQAGVQMSWDLFDGRLTQGKVREARAQLERTQVEIDDAARRIELEVRTSFSNLAEAWEVLESQRKVQEQAEEALRLARARAEAGTGTQLDVLSAQTALTEARTTQIQAQRDYAVARTRVERAVGAYVPQGNP